MELKKIADLREEFQQALDASRILDSKICVLTEKKIEDLVKFAADDFTRFFESCGYQIEKTDGGLSAQYKTISVTFNVQDPGRRGDDIFSLKIINFNIGGDPGNESFKLFIQLGDIGKDPKSKVSIRDESGKKLYGLIQDYRQNTMDVGELLAQIETHQSSFKHSKNLSTLEELQEICNQHRIEMLQKMKVFYGFVNENYVFSASLPEDTFRGEIKDRFSSFYQFLENLDQMESLKLEEKASEVKTKETDK